MPGILGWTISAKRRCGPLAYSPFSLFYPAASGGGKSVLVRQLRGLHWSACPSDMFLGYTVGAKGKHFFVRQLWDMKISLRVETFGSLEMHEYAKWCGRRWRFRMLAPAHRPCSAVTWAKATPLIVQRPNLRSCIPARARATTLNAQPLDIALLVIEPVL